MRQPHDRAEATDDSPDAAGSRSQKRRDALAVLALARQLVELPPSRLARLGLDEDLREEITTCRRTPSHIAHKRQLAFLAKKMRQHDDAEFATLRAELGEDRNRQRQENAELHRLEALREELLASDAALSTLIAAHPNVDRQHLRSLIRRAREEKAHANAPARAYRELHRLLKSLDTGADQAPPPPAA